MNRYDDSRIEQLRIPPQSIDAEQAVLGGIMLAHDGYAAVRGIVCAEDFYRRDHRLIFQAISELDEKKRPYDAVTLGEWFGSLGIGEEVDGGAYLIELASSTPSAANIVAYAHIVKDKATLRKAIDVGTAIVNAGFHPDGRSSDEVLALAQGLVGGLYQDTPDEMMPGFDAVEATVKRVKDRREIREISGSAIAGISCGIHDLDEKINGLEGGGLYVIAGRPGMGKSTLAQNMAEHIAMKLKKPVDIFSYEMPEWQYTERMIIAESGLQSSLVRCGNLNDADWDQFRRAANRVSAAPWNIAMPKTRDARHIGNQARRLHAKKKRGAIIVDYLQLLKFATKGNRNDEIGEITGSLKQLAMDLDCPVIVLAQLNRELEKREDKRPVLGDLRDSGSIEQDADVVLFVYRDDYYNKNSKFSGTAEIIIGKQRSGESGDMVRVACDLPRYRFSQLPFDWEPPRSDEPIAGPTSTPHKLGQGRRKPAASPRDAAAGE